MSFSRRIIGWKSREGKVSEGYPSNADGKDGDEEIRFISGKGLYLFKKYHNEWYGVQMTKLSEIKRS